jgi:hypothetical protein
VNVGGDKGRLHLRGRLTLSKIPKRIAMRTFGAAGQWALFINGKRAINISNCVMVCD